MYLTKDATAATLRQLAGLAPRSTLAMTFMLPTELLDEADRPGLQASARGARAAGTPFISFYTPQEMLALAREVGFTDAQHVSGTALAERYFADRTDGLRPSSGEDLLLATTLSSTPVSEESRKPRNSDPPPTDTTRVTGGTARCARHLSASERPE